MAASPQFSARLYTEPCASKLTPITGLREFHLKGLTKYRGSKGIGLLQARPP
jgi:hypothetical protein